MGQRPMAIYWGSLEEAVKHHLKGWQEFPYKSQGQNESFSKVLFRALGFPEVKADSESNLTMNQILRLAYVDQISKTTALMREEDFDSILKRKTIAELLFGVYDDTLYADEINLRQAEIALKDIEVQIRGVEDVFEAVGEKIDGLKIQKETESTKARLSELLAEIQKANNESTRIRDTSSTEIYELRTLLENARAIEDQKIAETKALKFEISDASIFITTISNRLRALEDSLHTRATLGDVPNCPYCDIPIKELEGKTKCQLSGREIQGDFGKAKMLKMREELRYQLKESNQIQEKRRARLIRLEDELRLQQERTELARQSFQQKIKTAKSARDNRLDSLFQERGKLESAIEQLAKLKKYVDVMARLGAEKGRLNVIIAELKTAIEDKRRKMSGRWHQANAAIEQATKYILANDLPQQEEFRNVESFSLEFGKNTFLLNGKNNFSASSNAILKNAVNFGILFASSEDDEFRFPRFILCDNIEDGGMTEPRSKNFQKVIAAMSEQASKPFQIIFSTSMIDESLDNTPYCVGPYYTRSNKSLDLAGGNSPSRSVPD